MINVKLSQIPEDGALKETGLQLSLEELGLGEPFLEPPGVSLDYELRRIYGKVLAKMKASARIGTECSRCLEPFEQGLEADFLVEFEPRPEDPNPRSLDVEDPGLNVSFIEGEEVRLGEEVRQELELQVPLAPLCRPDCKGLCPNCGKNRNQGPCGCPSTGSGRGAFDKLNELFKEKKEKDDA